MTHLSSFVGDREDANASGKVGRLPHLRLANTENETASSGRGELALTFKPHKGENLPGLFRRLADTLKESETTVLKLVIFGPVNVAVAATESMRRAFGKVNWPVTWVEGVACDEGPVAGIHVFAFNGGNVGRLTMEGRVVGSVFEDEGSRYCLLGGLWPNEFTPSRTDQTKCALEQMQTVLAQGGFNLGNVVRTWFFLDDLLSWYDSFNEVRTSVYSQTKFNAGFLPASTGIGGRNPAGAALTVGARAMQTLDGATSVKEIISPLQCPAPEYGSSFSRAIEINSTGSRQLFISGTASIAPDGRTMHAGNAGAQIGLSMRVVEAILDSRRMSFADVTRATAYFKSPADAPAFVEWCDRHELRKLPVISTGCDICRRELLFEVEVDAVSMAERASL